MFRGSIYLLTLAATILVAGNVSAIVAWTNNINTNNVIVITNAPYNAATNLADNASALQSAINAATAGGKTNGLVGGTVEIPPGIFLSGPLTLKSSVHLHLDAGAILRMRPFGQYPVAWFTNGGTNIYFTANNFISGTSLTNIAISGPGAIDGQGLPWWPWAYTNNAVRPIMIRLSNCNRELIQNITLSNSPMFHISISGGSAANTTVQGVTVRAPSSGANPPSHNTDACDVSGTNVLVQNCDISTGDDNFTCGGGTHDVLLTNNTYGAGHGISIGSYTDSGGVSNITVVNCTISGADNGIRIKSDAGRGGLVQNINYFNIGITNVHFPIQVYAYYNWYGTPSGISPQIAASTNAVSPPAANTPAYRNITFSNINATSVSGYPIGIIWARTEMPATNIVFNRVNVTGNRAFDLYNVVGAKFIDCNLKPSVNSNTFSIFNAQVIITNSTPTNTLFTFNGMTANGYGNALAFYNAQGSLNNTNALDDGPLTLAASTFIVSNDWNMPPATALNFNVGTNTTKLGVVGNLALGGTNNVFPGAGFSNGVYPLITYTGALAGSPPVLGARPVGYNYSLDTNTLGQVNLLVTLLPPTNLVASATNLQINLSWNAVPGATSYNLKRGTASGDYPTVFTGLMATNFGDVRVTNAAKYFYVVSAVGAGGESTNSLPVSATSLPSNQPANISALLTGNQLQLAWPQDHLGWRLQMQTNDLAAGLSSNWATVPNSTNVMATNLVIRATNGSVFFRLIYP